MVMLGPSVLLMTIAPWRIRPVPSAVPPPERPSDSQEPASGAAGEHLWQSVREYWQSTRKLLTFYFQHRRQLWLFGSGLVPQLQPARARRRQIRLQRDQQTAGGGWTGSRWEITLPDCCAICGASSAAHRFEEERPIVDLTWPFWAPTCGALLGMVVALFLWWKWVFPIFWGIGFVIGYRHRGTGQAAVRYSRCSDHQHNTRLPSVWAVGDVLVVRVGHPAVKQRFFGKTVWTEERTAAPATQPIAPAHDESPIPLADQAESTVRPDGQRHDQ